jgi:hypothetical protein
MIFILLAISWCDTEELGYCGNFQSHAVLFYLLTGLSEICVEQCECCWFSGYGYRSNLGGFWHWCFIWRSTTVHL